MGGNTFGTSFQITTYGESHGPALGVIIDGIEPGFTIDMDDLAYQMSRRRPGGNRLGTERNEADEVEILSGTFEGKTTGTPISILIRNTNQRSHDYSDIAGFFRPGHADFTWQKKFGIRDWRGGGRSSGRNCRTACRRCHCHADSSLQGISITAYTTQIGSVTAKNRDLSVVGDNLVSCCDPDAAIEMEQLIDACRTSKESVGGIIECVVTGCPAGLGEPVFQKTEALLAHAVLSIGATKGIEFGEGFAASQMSGSQHNDEIGAEGFLSNHAGGINGGITNGEAIFFRVPVKPTASIEQPQKTIDLEGHEQTITVKGRHDPSIVVRIVPVIEAMTAITILSLYYDQFGRS